MLYHQLYFDILPRLAVRPARPLMDVPDYFPAVFFSQISTPVSSWVCTII